jgi:hypothetical protein
MKWIGLTGIVVLLAGCKPRLEHPDYYVADSVFVKVLRDFQLAEAAVRLGYHQQGDSAYVADSIYQSVFKKHGLSTAGFDSNFNYRLRQPGEMAKLYDEVIEELSTRTAEIGKGGIE